MFVLELQVLPVLQRSLEGSGAPMDFADVPTHSHPANYHPHPFAQQDRADEDVQEVIAHLEEMRRLRGQQVPLFDPGYSFPTTTAASASFNTYRFFAAPSRWCAKTEWGSRCRWKTDG